MSQVFIVTGLKELRTTYRELPDKMKRGVIRRGVYAAARIVAEESKKRAPILQAKYAKGKKQPGILKRSIIVKGARELQSDTQVGFLVTALQGKKAQRVGKKGVNKDAYYFRWVHEGHKIVSRGTASKTTRKRNIKARRQASSKSVGGIPFMRDALEAVGQQALNAMADKIRNDLATPGALK